MPDQSSDKAQSQWDRRYETDHAQQSDIKNIYTLASVLYWEMYGNKRLSNTGDEYNWMSWLRRLYGHPRPSRVLELGSGNGDLLLDLQAMDLADEFFGIDLSEAAIRVAREKVEKRGCTNITFAQGDLNQIELRPSTYDIIVAQMTMHHVERLERLFEQVAQALTTDGVFAINDYVGPTRWQFTPMQVLLANAMLWLLPRRLRIRYPDGELKRGIRRPSIEDMIAMDPSEAVRSQEILPLFEKRFTVEHCIDYGGSISILVLDTIISNFRKNDPQSLRWFQRILDIDDWARRAGIVPVINVVLAGRRRRI